MNLLTQGRWHKTQNGKWYLEGQYDKKTVKAYADARKIDNQSYTGEIIPGHAYQALLNAGKNGAYFVHDFIPECIPVTGNTIEVVFDGFVSQEQSHLYLKTTRTQPSVRLTFPVKVKQFERLLSIFQQKKPFLLGLFAKQRGFFVQTIDIGVPDKLVKQRFLAPKQYAADGKAYFEGYVVMGPHSLKAPARVYAGLLKKQGIYGLDEQASFDVSGEYNRQLGFYFINQVFVDFPTPPFAAQLISVSEDPKKPDARLFYYRVMPGIYGQQRCSVKWSNLAEIQSGKSIGVTIGASNQYSPFPMDGFLLDEDQESAERSAVLTHIETAGQQRKLHFKVSRGPCRFMVSAFEHELDAEGVRCPSTVGKTVQLPTQYAGRHLRLANSMPDSYQGVIQYQRDKDEPLNVHWWFRAKDLSFSLPILKEDWFLHGIVALKKKVKFEARLASSPTVGSTHQRQWSIEQLVKHPLDDVNLRPDKVYKLDVLWGWSAFQSNCAFALAPSKYAAFYQGAAFLVFLTRHCDLLVVLSPHLLRLKQVRSLNEGDTLQCRLGVQPVVLSAQGRTRALVVTELVEVPQRTQSNAMETIQWLACRQINQRETKALVHFAPADETPNDDASLPIAPYQDWGNVLPMLPNAADYQFLAQLQMRRDHWVVKKILTAKVAACRAS